MKIGTLFSGGGGFDVGARAAGLDLAWGIEYIPEIADVARRNLGDHIMTADILSVDPSDLPAVDFLHASPPCPNFSLAKAGAEETDLDIALALKVAEFVEVLGPRVFTLENVWRYRQSKSWEIVRERLFSLGYWLNFEHVNAADFGVPQTRKRMIVRAVRGGWVPQLPAPVPWVGWYASVADIVWDMPPCKLANWQIERLPADLVPCLVGNDAHTASGARIERLANEPAQTVTTQWLGRARAVLVGGANRSKSFAEFARQNRPTMPGVKEGDRPAMAVTATASSDTRAILLGNNANDTSGAPIYVDQDDPAQTLRTSTGGRAQRAILPGPLVVRITPRGLARLQSFPDDYDLPGSAALAGTILGNYAPPLLAQKIISQLLEGVTA